MLQSKSLGSVKILSVDYEALKETLKKKSGLIKFRYPDVEKILIFGSFARGNFTPESDVDILIIVRSIDVPFIKRADRFLDFFRSIPFDVNILVYTNDEITRMIENRNSFIESILKEAIEPWKWK